MKKLRLFSIIMMIAVMLFGGMLNANAVSSIPTSVVSDAERQVEFIKNYPVIVKTAENGKYYIYCMNQSRTYAGGIRFTKTGTVDPGFTYILNNRPQTSNKDRDFYVTQMAVWYYEDYLNQNNFNLVTEVKEYIIRHKDTANDPSKDIYALYEGAKYYKSKNNNGIGTIKIDASNVKFTEDGDYFVSSKITVHQQNINGNLKYSLSNAPQGSLIVKSGDDGIKVKIPVAKIDEGKQVTFQVNISGSYIKSTGYYYHYNNNYQNVLFQDPITENVNVSDSVSLTVAHRPDTYPVKISKTDITQTNEVAGATLVVRDEAGKVVTSWVSTNQPRDIILAPGKYTLTETIAPKGYKLSSTTISFILDEYGLVYTKNDKGVYVVVNKVIMINELLDMVSFEKRDSATKEYVSGAKLVIKNSRGQIVKEFISSNKAYSIELDPGYYTISEVSAPKGYLLSKEVIYFYLKEDGTLKVRDNKGVYSDTAMITFYNTKEKKQEVPVPSTDKNSTLLVVSGIALLIGGLACAKKTIKEC